MKRQEEYFGPLAPGVRSGSIVGGSGLQGSSERRRGPGEDKRDENKIEEARKRREKERTRKGGERARLQRERQDTGAVCSQLCLKMNVTAMLTLANTPASPQIQAPSPAMAPQGHQAGARTGGVGLGVLPDTTWTPLPCLSLGCRPLSHSGTLGVGWGRGVRVLGQRRESEESKGPEGVFSREGDSSADLESSEGEEER